MLSDVCFLNNVDVKLTILTLTELDETTYSSIEIWFFDNFASFRESNFIDSITG